MAYSLAILLLTLLLTFDPFSLYVKDNETYLIDFLTYIIHVLIKLKEMT